MCVQIEELAGHKAALQQWAASLQADFDYNLELLDGRDAELAQHEEWGRQQVEEIARLSAQNQELMRQLLLAQQSRVSHLPSPTHFAPANAECAVLAQGLTKC